MDFTVITIVGSTMNGMSALFIYCYFGKLATESYAKMSDCVFEMVWYEQPYELRKYFLLMITNMQKPIYYHGFGVATLNLETFVNVIESTCIWFDTFNLLIFHFSCSRRFFHITLRLKPWHRNKYMGIRTGSNRILFFGRNI